MEVKIKQGNEMIDATIEMVEGVMVVSPKVVKFEPKDGDVCKSTFCIYIFKRANNAKAVVYHCCLNVDQDELSVKESVGVGYVGEYQRYATEEEKQKLFDKLKEEGYEFDFEKKELVKLKWKPNGGEYYYYPSMKPQKGRLISYPKKERNTELQFDKEIIDAGWVFKTEEECQAFCSRLNEVINSVKP